MRSKYPSCRLKFCFALDFTDSSYYFSSFVESLNFVQNSMRRTFLYSSSFFSQMAIFFIIIIQYFLFSWLFYIISRGRRNSYNLISFFFFIEAERSLLFLIFLYISMSFIGRKRVYFFSLPFFHDDSRERESKRVQHSFRVPGHRRGAERKKKKT